MTRSRVLRGVQIVCASLALITTVVGEALIMLPEHVKCPPLCDSTPYLIGVALVPWGGLLGLLAVVLVVVATKNDCQWLSLGLLLFAMLAGLAGWRYVYFWYNRQHYTHQQNALFVRTWELGFVVILVIPLLVLLNGIWSRHIRLRTAASGGLALLAVATPLVMAPPWLVFGG
jgi:hypothetical protein